MSLLGRVMMLCDICWRGMMVCSGVLRRMVMVCVCRCDGVQLCVGEG